MKKKFDESAAPKKKPAKMTARPAANKAAKKAPAKPAKKAAVKSRTPKAPEPPVRMVTIPAHTIRGFDGLSCYEDGMAGRLRNCSDSYIEAQYGYNIDIPPQTFAFTSWDAVPSSMDKKTRDLLRETMDAEDRRTLSAQEYVQRKAEEQQREQRVDAQRKAEDGQRQAEEQERRTQAARAEWLKDRIVVNKPLVFRRP